MSKIYFFRHAQASVGAVNYDVLSPKGELQAAELGKYLANQKINFDKVYVGPLRRQQHTYEIVKGVLDERKIPIPAPITLSGLDEHKAPDAMKIAMPKMLETVPFIQKMWAVGNDNPEQIKSNIMRSFRYFLDEWSEGRIEVDGVLSWADFRKKVKEGLETILENTNSGETIAAFTSGGTISSITAESLNMTEQKRVAALNFSIRNTSFTSFLYSRNQFNLLAFNELPHLAGDMVTFV